MDIRIQKIIEGLFCLEDLREVYRGALPTGLSPEEEVVFGAKFDDLERIVDEIRTGTGHPKVTRMAGTIRAPPARGGRDQHPADPGRRPAHARGEKGPRPSGATATRSATPAGSPSGSTRFCKPPIATFHEELAAFVGMDQARVVPGARRGFQAVASSLVQKGDWVLLSALGHYTEYLAVEQAGGTVHEIPANDARIVTADAAAERLEALIRELGKPPALVMCDHFDYQNANEHEVAGIARLAHQYDAPFLYNGAYTVGVMPVDGKGDRRRLRGRLGAQVHGLARALGRARARPTSTRTASSGPPRSRAT